MLHIGGVGLQFPKKISTHNTTLKDDFDSICETLNHNTKLSPTKEISLINNLAQWFQDFKNFANVKYLSKYGHSGSTSQI